MWRNNNDSDNRVAYLHSLVVFGYASVSQTHYARRRTNLYIPESKRRRFTQRLEVRRIDRRTSSATRNDVLLARGIPLLEVGGRSVAEPPHPLELTQPINAIVSAIRVAEHNDCLRVGRCEARRCTRPPRSQYVVADQAPCT